MGEWEICDQSVCGGERSGGAVCVVMWGKGKVGVGVRVKWEIEGMEL